MIALDLGKTTFDIPENWGEVIAKGKYLDVVKINYTNTEEITARLQVLKALTGLDGFELGKALGAPTNAKRNALADELGMFFSLQVIEEVLPVFDFIFKPELITDNPLPVIAFKGIKYYGPDTLLQTQTGAEMEECGQAHAEFIKTGEEKWLDHLVAAMYRPLRFMQFGERVSFNAADTAERAKHFATLDPIVKRGVLLFYEMCEEWYRQQYSFMYNNAPGPAAQSDAAEQKPSIDSLAISRILRMLAGNKRGTVEQVRLMQRHEIFFELAELERERQAMEK